MFRGSVKGTGYPLQSPVHLNRPVGVSSVNYWQQSCAASAAVMLDTPCSEVVWRVLATHSIRQFPFTSPTVHHHISTGLYMPSYDCMNARMFEICQDNSVWFKKMGSISYVYISWTINDMWMIYITFERRVPIFLDNNARSLAYCTAVQQRHLRTKWLQCSTRFLPPPERHCVPSHFSWTLLCFTFSAPCILIHIRKIAFHHLTREGLAANTMRLFTFVTFTLC